MIYVEFAYQCGDLVSIKAINMQGRISALMTSIGGKEYRVDYWNDGERHTQWVYDYEIEKAE